MRSLRPAVSALSLLLLVCGSAAAESPAAPPAADIERRADSILSQMTLEEKIDVLGGVDGFFVRDFERLKLPRLKMADGPLGVRNFGPATAMAGGIALAATWNPALAERVGAQIGRDARAKGVHFLLGPGVNIYRAPLNGRNFEYFGEDPFLAARLAVGYVRGVQAQGVSATIKHYAANNSEFDRHNTDSIVDERTLREIYLPTFEAAVKEARVGAIMDSYNLLNGAHTTQHGYLNTDLAKKEWGFDGVMMSDWDATYDAVAAANGGLDLEMPSGKFLNRSNLLPAIEQKKVTVATIDDKVRRILRTAVRFGWLDREQTDFSIPRYNPDGRRVALEAAREGIVLLKNDGGLLPLDKAKLKSVAVIGPNAYPGVPVGGGSAAVVPFAARSALEALSDRLDGIQVYYAPGLPTLSEMAEATSFTTAARGGEPGLRAEYFQERDLKGTAVVTRVEQHVNFGKGSRASFPADTLSTRWTGYYVPQKPGNHDVFVASTGEDGGYYRLFVDDKLVLDNWTEPREAVGFVTLPLEATPHKLVLEQQGRSAWLGTRLNLGILRQGGVVGAAAKALASRADAVVVMAGFSPETESEGADRTFRLPPGQDELIEALAAANKNTIVVVTSGGSVDTSRWLDRVPALLQAWYPGQEGATAIAEILCGDVTPSGRLPISFERRWEDNPVHDSYYPEPGSRRVVFKEGVFVGYRGYEKNGVKPLFPFGYGLSYTTFSYANLALKAVPSAAGDRSGPRYEASFDVKNTGTREGADVAQLYVGEARPKVPRPAKELKGFARVALEPGETKRVSIALDGRAFSYYDATARKWRITPGRFDVLLGRSSDQIELRGTLTLAAATVD